MIKRESWNRETKKNPKAVIRDTKVISFMLLNKD